MADAHSKTSEATRLAYALGYRVDATGAVFNPQGIQLKPRILARGYLALAMKRAPLGFINVPVHRLAGYQRYGELIFDPDLEMRHLDGNRQNNCAANLEIGTRSQNSLDRPKTLRVRIGKKAAASLRLFTDEQILAIRAKKVAGATYAQLSVEFSAARSTLLYIVQRRTYPDV